jgi:hypothetical protein
MLGDEEWEHPVWITTDEAIEIYARFCAARYGANAISVVHQRVSELRMSGDGEGARVWNEVGRWIETRNQRVARAG